MHSLVLAQLERHCPTQTDFLIGLSGGIDSVVLLHLFARQPCLNLRAVHVHHGLSPNADDWAEFCRQLCRHYSIELSIRRVKIERKANLEAQAREARYQAVQQIIRPNEYFVTAHHLDDQAETFLLALKRGSGVKGLSAMQAVGNRQNFAIFRPLLDISKSEIMAYAESEKLRWIEDESNQDDRYDRNFLRNTLLPQANQRWEQFSRMVARSAQHCAEQQALMEELLHDCLIQRLGSEQQLDISGFSTFSEEKQRQLVRLWLDKCRVIMPSKVQLSVIIHELILAKEDRNPAIKLGKKWVRRYRQALFIVEESAEICPFSIDIPSLTKWEKLPPDLACGQIERLERTPTELICTIFGKTHRLSLPPELQNKPLKLCIGQQGKVQEYGKEHREELKKIWQQKSIPPWKRASTPLIFWQDKLLAVLD